MEVEISGSKFLTEKEREILNKLIKEYSPKIQRKTKDISFLKVYVKEHEKEGMRKKYNLKIEIGFSGKIIKAKAHDWDFARTVHKVLNKMIGELEHKYHASEQR